MFKWHRACIDRHVRSKYITYTISKCLNLNIYCSCMFKWHRACIDRHVRSKYITYTISKCLNSSIYYL